jgi:hypothetical protein
MRRHAGKEWHQVSADDDGTEGVSDFITTEHPPSLRSYGGTGTEYTEKIIVNFLLRKNLTIDFQINMQKTNMCWIES